MIELLIALAGAVVGAVITWALTRGDSKKLAEAQQEIVRVERERGDWERRSRQQQGLVITGRIAGDHPEPQFVQITANEQMEALRLDYCIDTGARVATWPLEPPLVGRELRIPIDKNLLRKVHNTKSDGRTGNADVYFKSLLRVLGSEREIEVPARVELRFGESGTNWLRVVG
jgi:hypothetical protein